MTVLLGFTLAAYNLDRVRSYRAKLQAEQGATPSRARRRRGTWAQIIDPPVEANPPRRAASPLRPSRANPDGADRRLDLGPSRSVPSNSPSTQMKSPPFGRRFLHFGVADEPFPQPTPVTPDCRRPGCPVVLAVL